MSFNLEQEMEITIPVFEGYKYRISGNFGAMEIVALLADDKNSPN